MNLEEIRQIIKELQESNLKKIVIKQGDEGFELHLEKEGKAQSEKPAPAPVVVPSLPVTVEEEPAKQANFKNIKAPIVGTFYSSSAPDQASFVKVGDYVEEDTVVCIIEAMKVMNEVKAGVKGKIKEILIKDAEPVEFGTSLFRVE